MILLNDKVISPTIFPDGTSQVWKIPDLKNEEYNIAWYFESEAEIIHLLQLAELLTSWDALDRSNYHKLYIDYFPYARQDKKVSNETTFARVTFLDLLYRVKDKFYNMEVTCFDPHSELPSWIKPIYPTSEIVHAYSKSHSDILVFPDNGAKIKYSYLKRYFPDSIHAEKVRDQSTGHIASLDVIGDCKDKRCLIVDDICDGGMTFIMLARELYKKGALSVALYISHGLFTKGTEILKDENIGPIFTKNGEIV